MSAKIVMSAKIEIKKEADCVRITGTISLLKLSSKHKLLINENRNNL